MRTGHRPRITMLSPGTDLRILHNRDAQQQQHHSVFRHAHESKRALVSTQFLYKMSLFWGEPAETRGVCLFTRCHAPSSSRRRRHHRGVASTRVSLEGPRTQTHAPPHTLKTAPKWLKRPRDEVRQCEYRPAVTVCALSQPFASAGVSVQGEDARDAAPSRITAA